MGSENRGLNDLIQKIANENELSLHSYTTLAGGDSSQVLLLKLNNRKMVLKINVTGTPKDLFLAEANGLSLIAETNSFQTPKVISHGITEDMPYLLLDYLTTEQSTTRFWNFFTENLVQLHKTTQLTFGLDHDNYIGRLQQFNSPEHTSADFYLNQRLIPQFRLAETNGFRFEKLDILFKNVLTLIPKEIPALIHGDLWNGNYLSGKEEAPVLIDPAVCYASREMDLAMMQLFGGFPDSVFNGYDELFPLEQDWKDRIALYQLYYLLVHLNLFGKSYHARVQQIVQHYS